MAGITREELLARYATGERDFSGLDLTRLDLSNIKDEIRIAKDYNAAGRHDYALNHCIFQGANLSYVNFSGTHIMFCDFRDAILFRADFSDTDFSGANFTGADLREANLNARRGIWVIFENVDFRGCSAIGSFSHERTLCLRNCIGQNGKIIELFDEETVMRELDSKYIDEWNGIPMDQIQRIGLSDTQSLNTGIIDEDSIAF